MTINAQFATHNNRECVVAFTVDGYDIDTIKEFNDINCKKLTPRREYILKSIIQKYVDIYEEVHAERYYQENRSSYEY